MSEKKEKYDFKIINSLADSYKKKQEKINSLKNNNLLKIYKDKTDDKNKK